MTDEKKQPLTVETSEITHLIEKVFKIQSVTLGGAEPRLHVQYRGHLTHPDSEAAYDQLVESLSPMGLMPLFRQLEGEQAILIVNKLPESQTGPIWVNIILLVLTILSVMFTGASFTDTGVTNPFSLGLPGFIQYLLKGWPFAISMLGILLAHELGHYFVGRSHGEKVTLPYFIPFPFSAFGTMGAFISMKETPKNKKHLMDIGVAGPLMGLLVAIPVLFIGLNLSSLGPIEADLPEGYVHFLEGNSVFYLIAKFITFGKILPQPESYGNMTPIFYWLRYFFTGTPAPIGGLDVQIHAVAWAGWAGLFITGINLIPVGQLDGGHILYVLLGKARAKKLYPIILALMVIIGIFWRGWWFWAVLLLFFGRRHAQPLDDITPIDTKRKILGMIVLIIFILIFIPVPLVIVQ